MMYSKKIVPRLVPPPPPSPVTSPVITASTSRRLAAALLHSPPHCRLTAAASLTLHHFAGWAEVIRKSFRRHVREGVVV